jgi:hypothetical protein
MFSAGGARDVGVERTTQAEDIVNGSGGDDFTIADHGLSKLVSDLPKNMTAISLLPMVKKEKPASDFPELKGSKWPTGFWRLHAWRAFTFLLELLGGQAQGDEARAAMKLVGWSQSVMLAADLKGSTAVINVKVEGTTIKEEVLVRVDEVNSPSGKKGLGKRNGRRILERHTESTALVVSDMLDPPPALSPGQAITPAVPTARKGKREGRPDTEARKVTSTKARAKVERARISDMLTSSQSSLSVVIDQGGESDTKVQKNNGSRLSRRSERYSVGYDKLEVGVSGDSNDVGRRTFWIHDQVEGRVASRCNDLVVVVGNIMYLWTSSFRCFRV